MRMQTSSSDRGLSNDSVDPWLSRAEFSTDSAQNNNFEDSFSTSCVSHDSVTSNLPDKQDLEKLPDSDQYLARLESRLKDIQGGTSKRDLIKALSVAKEDCIARLITGRQNLETPEEKELAANPLVRHIVPHLQALTESELVHLLKADALQQVVEEQIDQPSDSNDTEKESAHSTNNIQI